MEEVLKNILAVLSDNTIEIIALVVSSLSTVLWGFYVWFTIKTFREIKEQTKIHTKSLMEIHEQTILQYRSFLVAKPVESELNDFVDFSEDAIKIHQQWQKILMNNLPDAAKQEESFTLLFINRGKSDIIKWQIKVTVFIEPGVYLHSLTIQGDTYNFNINSKSTQQIGPGEELCIKIIPFGFYPKARINWQIDYEDVRNNKDRIIEQDYYVSNKIAYDYKSSGT